VRAEESPVITRGVPQGIVAGPILSVKYTDDAFRVFQGSAATHKYFADDLLLFGTV